VRVTATRHAKAPSLLMVMSIFDASIESIFQPLSKLAVIS
jgi:hypothetical protein